MKTTKDEGILVEMKAKCINCDNYVKVIVRPSEDLSGYICPQCEGMDLGGESDW